MLSESVLTRLRHQLTSLDVAFPETPAQAWEHKPTSGKWSARENLAHLARYHEVFLERVEKILREDRPTFSRYRAEDDQKWPLWSALETTALQTRIRALRDKVIDVLTNLSETQLARTGIHPALGEMNIQQWLEFFLLHEAHHLYTILFRLRGA